MLAVAVLLSWAAHEAGPLAWDQGITNWVQGWPWPAGPMSRFVRATTTTQVLVPVGLVLAAVLWIRGHRAAALAVGVTVAALPLAQAGLKDLIDRPRPDPALVDRRADFTSESFPSGHMLSSTVVLGLVFAAAPAVFPWPALAGAIRGAAVVLIALGGPASTQQGVHWPSDSVGGFLWAAVLLIPALYVIRERGAPRAREQGRP